MIIRADFKTHVFLIGLIFLSTHNVINAQIDSTDFISTKIDSIEQDIFSSKSQLDVEDQKRKKVPKNFYFGYKTRKGYTKTRKGNDQIIELFNYLKTYQEPNKYVPDFFWIDLKGKQIKKNGDLSKIDKRYIGILHGPYLKMINKDTVEMGSFYIGVKHKRWETYKPGYMLKDKKNFYKGWPAEAQLTYYDVQRTKLKEVLPIEFGRLDGDYFKFYENGTVGIEGQYKNGIKVDKWIEYYSVKRKRKSEIQYTTDPYNKTIKPYKLKEWDEKGNLIYDWEREKNKKKSNSN